MAANTGNKARTLSEFVTLSRKNKQFWPVLTGRFSKTHFAQPVRSLNVNCSDETVTFKIIERKSSSLFGALRQWYSLPRNIYLTFPLIVGLSFLFYRYGEVSYGLVLFSFLSLESFFMALTLYNDYSDYVNGVDRINEYSVGKPLVHGFIRPYQAYHLAAVFLFLSFLFGTYCFYKRPLVIVLVLWVLVVGFTFTSGIFNRRYKGLNLFNTFWMTGPLLILGYEFLLYGGLSLASALLGGVFGYHALKYDFCRQVQDIYYNSRARISTLSTLLGFEASKFVYSFLSLGHILILGLFASILAQKEIILLIVVSVCFEVYVNHRFYKASSFLSSHIGDCLSLQKLHYTIESGLFIFIFLGPLWLSLF